MFRLPHLSPHPVHGDDGSLVRVEVYKSVSRRLAGELVCHHLDAHHACLAHHGHRILVEGNISLKLKLENKRKSN